jgi:hypothetical protein
VKKIQLSKETLRVLTSNEAELVAGGVSNTCIPKQGPCGTETVPVNACASNNCTVDCPTAGCPTAGCPPQTQGCSVGCPTAGPACTTTETRRRPRCVIP